MADNTKLEVIVEAAKKYLAAMQIQEDGRKNAAKIRDEKERLKEEARLEVLSEQATGDAKQTMESTMAQLIADQQRRVDLAMHTPRTLTALHEAQVANVLKMMEMLGDAMQVEDLQHLIDPFVKDQDWQTLHLLRRIVEKRRENGLLPTEIFGQQVNWGRNPMDELQWLRRFEGVMRRIFDPGQTILGAGLAVNTLGEMAAGHTAEQTVI